MKRTIIPGAARASMLRLVSTGYGIWKPGNGDGVAVAVQCRMGKLGPYADHKVAIVRICSRLRFFFVSF